MHVEPRPEGNVVVKIGGEYHLRETIPARVEVDQPRAPGVGPWRLYKIDDLDSDFAGGSGMPYSSWNEVLAAAKSVTVGYRAYVDDSSGACVLKVVHRPAQSTTW